MFDRVLNMLLSMIILHCNHHSCLTMRYTELPLKNILCKRLSKYAIQLNLNHGSWIALSYTKKCVRSLPWWCNFQFFPFHVGAQLRDNLFWTSLILLHFMLLLFCTSENNRNQRFSDVCWGCKSTNLWPDSPMYTDKPTVP